MCSYDANTIASEGRYKDSASNTTLRRRLHQALEHHTLHSQLNKLTRSIRPVTRTHRAAPHDHQSASTRRHHLSLGALTAACRHHMASTCHHHTASPCRHQPHTRKRKNAQWFSLSKSGTHVLHSTASKSHHQATQQHPPDSHLQPHLSAAHYQGAYRVFHKPRTGPSQPRLTYPSLPMVSRASHLWPNQLALGNAFL